MEFPSFTKTWHNKTYAAINPTNPNLSAANRTVFITGGGAGVGRSISQSFASAGAATIAISGRRENVLQAAKKEIEALHPKTRVLTYTADVLDEKAMNAAFASVGSKIDVLVHNAGYLPNITPVATADLTEWWQGFEVNIKGSIIVTRAFLKHAAKDAVLIALTTGIVHLPPLLDYSSYGASKLAGLKFFDSVQVENPELRVVNVHPGVIKSDMSDKSAAHGERFPFDDGTFARSMSVEIESLECTPTDDSTASFLAQRFHCVGF